VGVANPVPKARAGPLGNCSLATSEDRLRWSMLGGEACLVDMPAVAQPELMPDPGPDLSMEPPRAPAPARAAAVVEDPTLALVPAMTDEDVEAECPRCSYCVLGGDWECGQCGLARMTHPAQPDVSAGEVEGARRLKSALKRPGGAKNEARIAFADTVAVISIAAMNFGGGRRSSRTCRRSCGHQPAPATPGPSRRPVRRAAVGTAKEVLPLA